ncbi:tagatose 1,6-diphosphate aldolase [Chloroflexota bacterium]
MNMSIGKIRGLQHISTADGVFSICAADHRGSLKTLIEKEQGKKVGHQDIVDFKLELCYALAPYSSAFLFDPIYGAAHCIAGNVLPSDTGLLVSIEESGYQSDPGGRITNLLKDWSVEKIKRMGGSAVKILIYYRPDLTEVASRQLKTIKMLSEECIKHDIPFLVEPVSYPVKEEKDDRLQFSIKKPALVIETAGQITALPIDVLKSEFPVDMSYETDREKVLSICQELNEASRLPWVLLSAGVDYEMFREQVEIACKAGASGFLGGRAIWQEMAKYADKNDRTKFLNTTVVQRFKELADIASKYAVPWYRKLGLQSNELAIIPENWYEAY